MDPDVMMETAAEGAKALTKLQEIIQKIFGPKWTRAQAAADMDANARRLQMIRDNPDMMIAFVGEKMYACSATPDELCARAEQRMLTDAVRQEANIEKVLRVAAGELHAAEKVSDEPVDEDWITRLFGIVKDVSNEEMQYVWGKILAGEIAAPKSFSLKTLDILRNISAAEAQVFQKLIPLVVRQGGDCFLLSDSELLQKHDVAFSDVLLLDECGLVNSSGMLTLNTQVTKHEPGFFLTDEWLVMVRGNQDGETEVSVGVYALTKAGRELYAVLAQATDEDYVKAFAQCAFEENGKNVTVSVHKLLSEQGDQLTYDETPVATYTDDAAK